MITPHPHPKYLRTDLWDPEFAAPFRLLFILGAIAMVGALSIFITNSPGAARTEPASKPAPSAMRRVESSPAAAERETLRENVREFQDLELRAWTDRAGKQVRAVMVAASANTVTLATPEGQQRTFPRAAFSPADLAYVDWILAPVSHQPPMPMPPPRPAPGVAQTERFSGVLPPAIAISPPTDNHAVPSPPPATIENFAARNVAEYR